MKRRCGAALCLAVFLLSAAALCRAHGVDGYADQATGYCVTARYSDGEPMSWAEIKIAAPDSDIEFQNGRTDRNGKFMFLPDGQGAWEVVVQDGMGHRMALEVMVSGAADAKGTAVPVARGTASGKSRPMGVVAGVGVIFGLCGFFYGWKARRTAA